MLTPQELLEEPTLTELEALLFDAVINPSHYTMDYVEHLEELIKLKKDD